MADCIFVVADKLLEQQILDKMQKSVTSQKRKREEAAETKPCRSWASSGFCVRMNCKFVHDGEARQSREEAGRDMLRAMSNTRMRATECEESTAVSDGPGVPIATSIPPVSEAEVDEVEASASALVVPATVTPFSMLQRYYTPLYCPDADGIPGNDQYVHLQANRTCLVGLAPSHPVCRLHLTVTSVTFAPTLADITVSGKRKHGNIFVDAKQTLATITTACGKKFVIRSGMRGDVMEVNSLLTGLPSVVSSHPGTVGHFAVLDLKLYRVAEAQLALLKVEDYTALCAARGLPSTYEQALGHGESSLLTNKIEEVV